MLPKNRIMDFPSVVPFRFCIRYNETDRRNHWKKIDLHTHNEYELYVNLSGDISFMVENRLYPLTRGDIILARPGEFHHCVYHSDASHKFFWILVDADANRELLDFFFGKTGVNYISPQQYREELITLCWVLLEQDLTDGQRYYYFFRLMKILSDSAAGQNEVQNTLPPELHAALEYIDAHLTEQLKVSDIAQALYISQSTLERRFRECLDCKPAEFIRKQKLMRAATLLREGRSVLQAGLEAGFSDNSYFISQFRRYYGVTPLKYRKMSHDRA